jgi:hypothetical protein
MSPLSLLPGALPELFAQVSESGRITVADRYGLLAAILNDDRISPEDKQALNRILRATVKGRIRLVDELSQLP